MKKKPRTAAIAIVGILSLLYTGAVIASAPNTMDPLSDEAAKGAVFLLIAFVAMALVFSFLCSVAEAVLLSITPSYIESLRETKPQRSKLLKRLRQDHIDRSLAAILTMNTIAHTVGAIEAGAQSAVVFGSAWIGFFSAVMTLSILFLSEIIPKTLGAVYWAKLTGPTVFFIRSLIIVLYPLVLASEWLTKLITRGKRMHRFSREEFIAMVGVGEQTGHIYKHESRFIRNLFRFGSLEATDIMTPRIVISALPQKISVREALNAVIKSAFSRLPVYGKDIDDIKGFVLKDEILMYKSQGREDTLLEAIKRDILTVPAEISLPRLLEFLLDHRQHIVTVVDEYGGTIGLVTLEDVVETLLGMEIMDETDNVEDMQVLARQQWAKRVKALGLDFANNSPTEQTGQADDNKTKT